MAPTLAPGRHRRPRGTASFSTGFGRYGFDLEVTHGPVRYTRWRPSSRVSPGGAYSNIDQVIAAHSTAKDLPVPEENR